MIIYSHKVRSILEKHLSRLDSPLRKKMNDLRKKPEFQDNARERVKIVKGELLVDDNVVDRNTFSSFQ